MMRFANIKAFLAHLDTLPAAIAAAEATGLEQAAIMIRDEARAEIGHYQGDAGPVQRWRDLAPSTLADKERLGYAPPDNPLLREGSLRDAISWEIAPFTIPSTAVIGVKWGEAFTEAGVDVADVAIYQEFGTPDARDPIPPRSFLAGAAVRKTTPAVNEIGMRVAWAIAGLAPGEVKHD